MPYAKFDPCPHCGVRLSYLEGIQGSTMTPKCPVCHELITVWHATFLMADHSRPRTISKTSEAPVSAPRK